MSRNAHNGENGENGEKSPASGDLNWMPKVAPWRLVILAKMAKLAILAKIARGLTVMVIKRLIASPLAIFAKIAKIASLQGATFDTQFKSPEAGDFSPVLPFLPLHAFLAIFAKIANFDTIAGDLNWMPKVALWRLAILVKLAILRKLPEGWR